MRTKVSMAHSRRSFSRLLAAFEQELLAASDQEVMEAAEELGMKPTMKGSAAFAGLRYPTRPRTADFFSGADTESFDT
jgi:hypothetical protein